MSEWKKRLDENNSRSVIVKSIMTVQLMKERQMSTRPAKKLSPIDRLKRALSFGIRKKESTSSGKKKRTKREKPVEWKDDEKFVRAGTCNFNVKYLGGIEVKESRGIEVCEQGIQALMNQKTKYMKAILHISGDALRVVDQTNKILLVDQTIEKVSFCAPDRYHEKGFAYISRDGTTRRWLCHGFLAIKEKYGERLSHAVGCAFDVCLERKQKRDRDCNVTIEYTPKGTSFARMDSFRTSSIAERMVDPQSGIVAEPIPSTPSDHMPNGIERPRPKGKSPDAFSRSWSICTSDLDLAVINLFQRQSSMTPSDSSSIQGMKCKNSLTDTIPEEIAITSTISEFQQLALFDSTNTINQNHCSLPPAKSSVIPLSDDENTTSDFFFTNSPSTISKPTTAMSINDIFDSNLNALIQSNHPTNPFSPYGHSMAAHGHFRQSSIFTPKRGTNPFDDDLVRR